MRFKCRRVGLDFIEGAACRFENVVELDASPEAVFDTFAASVLGSGVAAAVQRHEAG